ncbi:MAG: hypothetical protein WC846_03200 [Candidatus Gracilibacteria bacterium]
MLFSPKRVQNGKNYCGHEEFVNLAGVAGDTVNVLKNSRPREAVRSWTTNKLAVAEISEPHKGCGDAGDYYDYICKVEKTRLTVAPQKYCVCGDYAYGCAVAGEAALPDFEDLPRVGGVISEFIKNDVAGAGA